MCVCVCRIVIDDVMNFKRNDEMDLKGTGGNRVNDGNYEKVKIKKQTHHKYSFIDFLQTNFSF